MLIKNDLNSIAVHLSLSFLLVLITAAAVSGSSSHRTASIEKSEIPENIRNSHRNTHSIKATVYQEKNLRALNKPVHVKGTVILEKPGMLRWEAFTPEKSIMVINRKTLTKYYPDAREAEIQSLSDNFIARNTMTFFSSVMWGALEKMDKRFRVDISGEEGTLTVTLTPLSKMVSKYLSSIIIIYDEKNGMPQGFEVRTPAGDKTVTRLEDVEMDPVISDDTFMLKLPPNVVVNDFTEEPDFN
ncbi:MAG: outer membrane lipoprotein carrier protein LolA [Nitrospirota bacterium]